MMGSLAVVNAARDQRGAQKENILIALDGDGELARLRQLMSLPGWNNFTAWSDTEIAANIMVFARRENDETIGTVEDLFVQKPWRRRGIARYLLHTALTYLRDLGIHHVQLEMWSANKPALHLYRAFGFSRIDETEIAVGRYV